MELKSIEEYHDLVRSSVKTRSYVIVCVVYSCEKASFPFLSTFKALAAELKQTRFAWMDMDVIGEDEVMELGVESFPHIKILRNGQTMDETSGSDWKALEEKIRKFAAIAKEPVANEEAESRAPVDYEALMTEVQRVMKGERDMIANTANVAAAVWHALRAARGEKATNWTGFYYVRKLPNVTEKLLVLGPFQGKPACKRIKFGSGVCGTAAKSKASQLVYDVNKFPGHIACDSASKSEVVVPIKDAEGNVVAVLDIDCPEFNGFNVKDQVGLERVAEFLGKGCDWFLHK